MRGAQIADRIDGATNAGEYARSLAVADKLRHCSSCSNVWYAEDVQNKAGELYEATGTNYACSERLCPSCLAKRSRIARARAREGFARAGRHAREIDYLITLTIPTIPASKLDLLQSLLLLLDTWRRFTKTDFYSTHIIAGVKGVEFTLGDPKRLEREGREWLADIDGWHPHLHLVTRGPWINANRDKEGKDGLRQVWTSCYKAACAEFHITPTINTKDGFLNCHLRYATQRKKEKTRGTIPLESAIIEACKYITKFDSWLKIPESQLLAIANIPRWPRMFELIGRCREEPQPSTPLVTTVGATQLNPLAIAARRKKTVRIHNRAMREIMRSYFNSTNLSAADSSPPECQKLPSSLRETGRMMIEQGKREEWRALLATKVKKVQEFRRAQLARMYPFAVFRTLDGQVWFGALSYLRGAEDAAGSIMEKVVDEQEAWEATVAGADRTELQRALDWQDRERWHAYVNDGPETPYGDVMRWYAYMHEGEPARSKGEAIAYRQDWFAQGLGVVDQNERNELRAARAFAWELSSRDVQSNA
jgi:hypothetical protein